MPEISLREACFGAIADALTDAALTCGGEAVTVLRNEMAPAEEDGLPLLVVMDGDQDPDESDTQNGMVRMRAIIAGYVAAETVAEQSSRVNELHAKALRALIRPGGASQPVPIVLADGTTQIEVEDAGMRVEMASILESERPDASFTMTVSFMAYAPWGNPFITTT